MQSDIATTGLLSAAAYIITPVGAVVAGFLADYIQKYGYLTVVQLRKTVTCTGFVLQICFLLGAIYLMSPVGTTVCFCFVLGIFAFSTSGALYLV